MQRLKRKSSSKRKTKFSFPFCDYFIQSNKMWRKGALVSENNFFKARCIKRAFTSEVHHILLVQFETIFHHVRKTSPFGRRWTQQVVLCLRSAAYLQMPLFFHQALSFCRTRSQQSSSLNWMSIISAAACGSVVRLIE